MNKHLVSIINNLGGKAIGLCGLDGALFQAKKLDEKYGLVGKIVKVAPQVVNDALSCGYIPVISTVALGIDNDTAYNINAEDVYKRQPKSCTSTNSAIPAYSISLYFYTGRGCPRRSIPLGPHL